MEKQTNEQTNKTKIKSSITYPASFSKQPQNRTNEKGERREKSGEEKDSSHSKSSYWLLHLEIFSERQKTIRCTPVQMPQPRSVFKNPGRYNSLF